MLTMNDYPRISELLSMPVGHAHEVVDTMCSHDVETRSCLVQYLLRNRDSYTHRFSVHEIKQMTPGTRASLGITGWSTGWAPGKLGVAMESGCAGRGVRMQFNHATAEAAYVDLSSDDQNSEAAAASGCVANAARIQRAAERIADDALARMSELLGFDPAEVDQEVATTVAAAANEIRDEEQRDRIVKAKGLLRRVVQLRKDMAEQELAFAECQESFREQIEKVLNQIEELARTK